VQLKFINSTYKKKILIFLHTAPGDLLPVACMSPFERHWLRTNKLKHVTHF